MSVRRLVTLLGIAACLSSPVRAAEPAEKSALSGLEIGTRVLYVVLDEESRDGTLKPFADPSKPTSYANRFLGTINELDVDQEYAPIRLYLQYFFTEHFGVGISYDRLEVDTRDELKSDGILTMDGPILYGIARKACACGATPFAELGVGLYSTSYDPDPSWKDAGPFGRRVMDTEDPVAFVIGLGVDYNVTETLSLNLYARAVLNATVDAEAYYSKNPGNPFATGEFPLDYYGFGIGVKYAFR